VILLLYVRAADAAMSALQQSAQHVAHYLPSFAAVESLLASADAERERLLDEATEAAGYTVVSA
jgi:hypothetical protein